jgi:hypothetical protein
MIPFTFNSLPDNFFRQSIGIDVGGIEEIDTGFEAKFDEAFGFGDVAASPSLEKFVAAAKRGDAEAENGDFRPERPSVLYSIGMMRLLQGF